MCFVCVPVYLCKYICMYRLLLPFSEILAYIRYVYLYIYVFCMCAYISIYIHICMYIWASFALFRICSIHQVCIYIHISTPCRCAPVSAGTRQRSDKLPKEPYIYSKEPYIYSKEPYIYSKEPYIYSKEPYIYSKEPYMHKSPA